MYMQGFLALLISACLGLGGGVFSTLAQSSSFKTSVDYTFGEQISLSAELESAQPVDSATVFIQAVGDTHTSVGPAKVESRGKGIYSFTYTHLLSDYHFRPYSRIEYRFEVHLSGGDTLNPPANSFSYIDNRFAWQELQEKPFHIHWYEGDVSFAQQMLDVAQEGLNHIQNLLPLDPPEEINIYTYADPVAMREALNPSSAAWSVGHADPDLGVILVALKPDAGERQFMEQRLPHEIMHVLLYQQVNQGYANLPVWLNEGMASLAELSPNMDYSVTLQDALAKGNLLPIASLCKAFPRDASGALLSYAESASFTDYIYRQYGSTGLQRLVTEYANGLDCRRAPEAAFGSELEQLERNWRREALGERWTFSAWANLLPWLVLLLAALASPLGLALARRRTGHDKGALHG